MRVERELEFTGPACGGPSWRIVTRCEAGVADWLCSEET